MIISKFKILTLCPIFGLSTKWNQKHIKEKRNRYSSQKFLPEASLLIPSNHRDVIGVSLLGANCAPIYGLPLRIWPQHFWREGDLNLLRVPGKSRSTFHRHFMHFFAVPVWNSANADVRTKLLVGLVNKLTLTFMYIMFQAIFRVILYDV